MKVLSSDTQCCLSVPHEETSQSDFDISWDLTEKLQGTQQGHKMSHNVGTTLLSGLLVIFCQWSCGMELLDETTIKCTETGGTYGYPNWLFGCSAWVTEPNSTQQVRYVGIQRRILFGMFKKIMISTSK